jgi:hypothetical protein
MDDDSTLGGLGPLTAILLVLAFALLGGVLYGAAGPRRGREPRLADGAPVATMPARRRRSLVWRVTAWTLRQVVDSFT